MRPLFLLLLLPLLACQPSSAPASAPPVSDSLRAAIETRLLAELSPATDRAGRQRNAIVNYAIDNAYDLQPAPEGYFYQILEPGEYAPLDTGDLVSAHYRVTTLDGRQIDASYDRGQPLNFYLGQMIDAWNLGLRRARPGGAIRLVTPSDLAYGEKGLLSPDGDTLVPAHTVLSFVVDNITLQDPEEN